MTNANPPQLVGTWEWSEAFRKSGEPFPPPPPGVPRITYTFRADGSGTMMPGTIAEVAMRWAVADGRLRLTTAVPKSRSTHDYETPDADTLVLADRHGGRNVFKRGAAPG